MLGLINPVIIFAIVDLPEPDSPTNPSVSPSNNSKDRLFTALNPDAESNFIDTINTNSLKIVKNCRLEPELKTFESKIPVQFERLGYFFKDADSTAESLVYNRTVALRDTWAKK